MQIGIVLTTNLNALFFSLIFLFYEQISAVLFSSKVFLFWCDFAAFLSVRVWCKVEDYFLQSNLSFEYWFGRFVASLLCPF